MATIAGVLRRPSSHTGVWGWVTTVDHKRIGIMYGISAFTFFLIGGLEAVMMRIQLMRPDQAVVSPEVYSQLFTMHALTMIFLGVMPLSAAFFNLVVPLQIGARDVAFPRLNALSLWVFLGGAIMLQSGWFLGGSPNAGWFAYAPLTEKSFNIGNGMDFYVLGLGVLG
ncbi:MAG: cbb3-type cytochrome c oxidase subunit I, partial [Chloroflexi bacterium]|nr:cbb3-type cytochrome c oxidase subunit I [Chloroflexota bacterium]